MLVSAFAMFVLIRSSDEIVHVLVVGFAAESVLNCSWYVGVIPIPTNRLDSVNAPSVWNAAVFGARRFPLNPMDPALISNRVGDVINGRTYVELATPFPAVEKGEVCSVHVIPSEEVKTAPPPVLAPTTTHTLPVHATLYPTVSPVAVRPVQVTPSVDVTIAAVPAFPTATQSDPFHATPRPVPRTVLATRFVYVAPSGDDETVFVPLPTTTNNDPFHAIPYKSVWDGFATLDHVMPSGDENTTLVASDVFDPTA